MNVFNSIAWHVLSNIFPTNAQKNKQLYYFVADLQHLEATCYYVTYGYLTHCLQNISIYNLNPYVL